MNRAMRRAAKSKKPNPKEHMKVLTMDGMVTLAHRDSIDKSYGAAMENERWIDDHPLKSALK